MPDPDSSRAPYLQVADAITELIVSGEWAAGSKLPSRKDLARQFGVAEMTVQNAWRELRERRLIVSRQGSGVFVRAGIERNEEAPADLGAELAGLQRRLDNLEGLIKKVLARLPPGANG